MRRFILTVTVAAAAMLALVPRPAMAQPQLAVNPAEGLDPAGHSVEVTGSGYDAERGVYVAWCVVPAAGQKPTPCGGGDDRGASGSSVWVSSNPAYGATLAKPYGPNGSFQVTVRVSRMIGSIDCFVTRCAVTTRNDHENTDDRSQDVFTPVRFQGQPGGAAPAPAPTAPPRPATTAATRAPATTTTTTTAVTTTTVAPATTLSVETTVAATDANAVRINDTDSNTSSGAPVLVIGALAFAALGAAGARRGGVTPAPGMTRRTIAAATAALIVTAAFSACNRSTAATPVERSARALDRIRPIAEVPKPALPARVTGDDGVEVTVADTSRIVPLNGGIAEIVFSLGLGRSVVARDVTTTFDEARDLPVVTNGHSISAEGLIAQRPTVVLVDSRTGPKAAMAQLRGAGIAVVVVPRALQLSQVNARIRAVAAALGLAGEGDALVRRTDAEIQAVKPPPGTKPVRVAFLYLRGSAAVYLLGGRGSGADGMIGAIRAVDVGAEAGLADFTPMTAEALVKVRPDVILVMTDGLESVGGIDGVLKLNGVAQTPAGQARRVVAVDDGLLLNFGPRTPAALKRLADGLAPFRQ